VIKFDRNLGGSETVLTNQDAAREFLQKKDEIRLHYEKIERPDYHWKFENWIPVEVKVILRSVREE